MTRTVTSEPLTVDEVRAVLGDLELPSDRALDLAVGAREAAESYTSVIIAQSTFTDEDGTETTDGWEHDNVPRDLKNAMYYYVVSAYELATAADWLDTFHRLLYPWRDVPCI